MDGRGVCPRPAPVGYGIGMLEVLEYEIHARYDRLVVGGRRVARGLDGKVQGSVPMQEIGEFRDEVGLQKRLAAGEGDAAARGGEDIRVREKLAGEFGDCPCAPANDFCPLGTDPFEIRRYVTAVSAMDAQLLLEDDLRSWGQTLWVVTPRAAERAALEENRSAYARAVVQAEFPHLEDYRCFLFVHARSIAQTAVLW